MTPKDNILHNSTYNCTLTCVALTGSGGSCLPSFDDLYDIVSGCKYYYTTANHRL